MSAYSCLYLPTCRGIYSGSVGKCFTWPQADTTVLMCLPPSGPSRQTNLVNGPLSRGGGLRPFLATRKMSRVKKRDIILSHSLFYLSGSSIFKESFTSCMHDTMVDIIPLMAKNTWTTRTWVFFMLNHSHVCVELGGD